MRPYNEFVARWGDLLSLPLTVLVLLSAAAAAGLLWYFWPSWWHALKRFRIRRFRRGRDRAGKSIREVTDEEIEQIEQSDEELPAVDAVVFVALADRLAAQGRFAEAIRERMRAMIRELVDRGVILHRPGWTVAELAREAGAARAPVAAPIDAACLLFTEVWYAKQPAGSEQDAQMRGLATQFENAMAGGGR